MGFINKMYRQMLKTYVVRSKQLELNNNSPEGKRWCNFLCQKYISTENFYSKQAGKNMCIDCSKKLRLVKIYINEGKITSDQFKENPEIIDNFNKQPEIKGDMECVECKKTKNLCYFDVNRNICKKCRKKQTDVRVSERLQSDIQKLEEFKNNEKTLKDILLRIPVNSIFSIMKHYSITRKSTDKKNDAIFKVINYFRQLQDPFKCMGNCGFSLEKEFSYCDGCKGNTVKRMSVEEKNHLFKENLDIFMENRYELTEEDMYTYNDFCIRSIAEYLGITMFKQKVKGNNKDKMVKIINEHLKEKQKECLESKQPLKTPNLELNGVMMVCREDGYVNATNLCKAGGKEFKHWNSLESTNELKNALF